MTTPFIVPKQYPDERNEYYWVEKMLDFRDIPSRDIFMIGPRMKTIPEHLLVGYARLDNAHTLKQILVRAWLMRRFTWGALYSSNVKWRVAKSVAGRSITRFIEAWQDYMVRVQNQIPEKDLKVAAIVCQYIAIIMRASDRMEDSLTWSRRAFMITEACGYLFSAGKVAKEIGLVLDTVLSLEEESVDWYKKYYCYILENSTNTAACHEAKTRVLFHIVEILAKYRTRAEVEPFAQKVIVLAKQQFKMNSDIGDLHEASRFAHIIAQVHEKIGNLCQSERWTRQTVITSIYGKT